MKRKGFTLLEMMVAMAILAGSLTWIVVAVMRNISAENHAKLMTTATFLARGKMVDTEDELYTQGFGEFEKNETGNFEDKGLARFTWKVVVDKVQLPSSEQLQTALTKSQEIQQAVQGGASPAPSSDTSASSSSSNPLTGSAGAMASQFGIIKDVLEQSIRRITVTVSWVEGKKPGNVEIVAYFTDPRKVDQAIQLSIPSGGATGGGATSGGTSGGTGGGTTGGTGGVGKGN